MDNFENIPDVRDGLNKKECAILYCLHQAQQERAGRNVPTVMLYGRVVELVDVSQEEFQTILSRFVGLTGCPSDGRLACPWLLAKIPAISKSHPLSAKFSESDLLTEAVDPRARHRER